MQCKDCLVEIDDKEYYNRSDEGVCKKCRQKKSQIKYENKKFGTNREYVPARLKNKSKNIIKKEDKKIEQKKNDEVTNKIYDEEIEKIVLADIENTFKNRNVSINFKEIPPFNIFMSMFCSLIDMSNGYMTQYKKAEETFNMMEGDYQHAYEDAQTPEIFLKRSQMFRCLLDQRREIKNGIGQYEKIDGLLQDIVKRNPQILTIARQAQAELEKVIEAQDGHYYKARASDLISKEDFCIGKKDWGQWHVEVPINNYYNNKSPYLFTRDVWANNAEEAIENIKQYLKQKFPNCTYKTIDFKAEKLVQDDVKECL